MKSAQFLGIFIALFAVAGSGVANADSADVRAVAGVEHANILSVSISRIAANIAELKYERAVVRHVSAAAMLALGAAHDPNDESDHRVIGLGLQGLYHIIGNLGTNLHAGVEARWERRSTDGSTEGAPVTVSSQAGRLGALVGANITTRKGFSVQGQLGLGYAWVHTTGLCCGNLQDVVQNQSWSTLGSLNFGWNF